MKFNFFSYFISAISVVFIALIGWFIVHFKKENKVRKSTDSAVKNNRGE
jgi:hypothetical protein